MSVDQTSFETTLLSLDAAAPKRVLSGMRPTGKLHLGNYMGALYNWVRLQGERDEATARAKYDCYFFIADWHALTTDYADTSNVRQNTFEVAMDWLAAGLDPEQSVIFVQSHVPQHAELHLLLSMVTPLSWLERVPTYKEQQENLTTKDLGTYGFLGYPLLMAADILVYQADFVPVGQDQVVHVELTREAARRFKPVLSSGQAGHAANPAGAAAAAHPVAKTAGHGWPQDVEELRQRHPDDGPGSSRAEEVEDDGHGPGAHSAH